MTLDVPTLHIVVTVLALLMAFWVCFMAWGQPVDDALWAWALALVFYALSHLLYGARDQLPQGVSVVVGNVAYAVTLALMLVALRRLQGVPRISWAALLPVLLMPVVCLLLLNEYRPRIIAVSLICALQVGLMLAALLDHRQPQQGRGRYILFVAALCLGLAMLLRAGATAWGWFDARLTVPTNDHLLALMFLVAMCAVLSITLGFVYMTMERAERHSFELAMKDMLTGLSNRRAISDELRATVARAQRQGQLLSVLMLDIDHFKRVNDSFGHQAGDVVLRGVAQTLQARLRAQDQIGRFGGEEFLVVLPDTGADGALILAESLRADVEATPTQWGAHSIAVTISIGVHGGAITGADTSDGLVAAADAALYRAKQGGRNRVEYAGG